MRNLFFFIVGLACVILGVVFLARGEAVMTSIGVILVGSSSMISNGIELAEKWRVSKNARDSA